MRRTYPTVGALALVAVVAPVASAQVPLTPSVGRILFTDPASDVTPATDITCFV